MSDWGSARRGPRRGLFITAGVVAAALVAAAFWVGRGSGPSPQAAPGGLPGGGVVAPASTAGSFTTGPADPGPADARDGGKGWRLPVPSPQAGPASRSATGVPFGYAHSNDGAMLAGVNALIAGRWMRYSSPAPGKEYRILIASEHKIDSLEWIGGMFGGGGAHIAAVPGQKPPDAAASASIAAKAAKQNCGCGLAVLGARVIGADAAGRERVTVAVQTTTFDPDRTVTLDVSTVGLIWEGGDWKVSGPGDNQTESRVQLSGALPQGFPLPAPDWFQR